jgi:hypothetical protein
VVNLSVPYARPDRSLLTLRAEIYNAYNYTPVRASEFVTGYKSADNYTGHNADANGIVHAMDIFTDENGNLPEAKGRELADRLRLIGKATGRFTYLIHDMCPTPGTAWPRIASARTGWRWVPYDGPSPHSDHIHISICDMYWGDPAPVPAEVYDSTAPWGIAGILAPAGDITPEAPKEWDDMVTQPELEAIVRKIVAAEAGKSVWGYSGSTDPKKPNAITMWRRVVNAHLTALEAVAKIAALTEVVRQLAATGSLDAGEVDAVVQAAVAKAIATNTLDVDINVNAKP